MFRILLFYFFLCCIRCSLHGHSLGWLHISWLPISQPQKGSGGLCVLQTHCSRGRWSLLVWKRMCRFCTLFNGTVHLSCERQKMCNSCGKQTQTFWLFWQEKTFGCTSESTVAETSRLFIMSSFVRKVMHNTYRVWCMLICWSYIIFAGRFTVSGTWTRWASLDISLQLWWRRHRGLQKTQLRSKQLLVHWILLCNIFLNEWILFSHSMLGSRAWCFACLSGHGLLLRLRDWNLFLVNSFC